MTGLGTGAGNVIPGGSSGGSGLKVTPVAVVSDIEQDLAEAIRKNAGRVDWGGVRPEDAARAAVAALAGQGDIADVRRFYMDETPFGHPVQVDDPKGGFVLYVDHEAALARQAAVHATQVAELERDIATGDNFVQEQATEIRALRATVERVEALRRRWMQEVHNTPATAAIHQCARDLRAALADPKEGAA